MKHSPLQPGGPMTLYAQLANILRDRVITGTWKSGEGIPTLEQLVEEFGVARVTVRQAVQMLVEEGLLSSQRGRRTSVTFVPPNGDANPLFSYIGSAEAEVANYSISVFAKHEVDSLPPQLAQIGKSMGKYVRIRKIDSQNGTPYAVSDNYVALTIFRTTPPHAERKMKISRLVRDHCAALKVGTEWITVATATYEEAEQLQISVGAPVAHVTRAFLTTDQKLAYVGTFSYRGDRFAIERDISTVLVSTPAKQSLAPPGAARSTEAKPRPSVRTAQRRFV